MLGFEGKETNALGKIEIPFSFGEGSNFQTEDIIFDVVDIIYPYNAIFRWASLNRFGAIPYHGYLCMKMPSPGGVITVFGDQQVARRIEVGNTPSRRNVHVVAESPMKPEECEEHEEQLQTQPLTKATLKG